jgi:hypothetical protein
VCANLFGLLIKRYSNISNATQLTQVCSTPMDERQHYSKSQMPKAGSAEALHMATLPYRELIGSLLWHPMVPDLMSA